MKDNFSTHATQYALYRPDYPEALYGYILGFCKERKNAWDCGTGNGQVASKLSEYFEQVYATDISQKQLSNAIKKENIHYSLQPAERTDFSAHFFDLIVVAQAIHWFDFDLFYQEVKRTIKPSGLLIVTGYGLISVNAEIDVLLENFYHNIIGPYWDTERRYIDEEYKTIPFPFEELSCPSLESTHQWSLDHFIGYLSTWSAVQHFIKEQGYNPVNQFAESIQLFWKKNEIKKVIFPILLRAGRVTETGATS
jgi:ubiquinone/menaquinone biosynthesis C-methylase UbiE